MHGKWCQGMVNFSQSVYIRFLFVDEFSAIKFVILSLFLSLSLWSGTKLLSLSQSLFQVFSVHSKDWEAWGLGYHTDYVSPCSVLGCFEWRFMMAEYVTQKPWICLTGAGGMGTSSHTYLTHTHTHTWSTSLPQSLSLPLPFSLSLSLIDLLFLLLSLPVQCLSGCVLSHKEQVCTLTSNMGCAWRCKLVINILTGSLVQIIYYMC